MYFGKQECTIVLLTLYQTSYMHACMYKFMMVEKIKMKCPYDSKLETDFHAMAELVAILLCYFLPCNLFVKVVSNLMSSSMNINLHAFVIK